MWFLTTNLHGAVGNIEDIGIYDELLFLSLGAILVVIIGISWFWSQPLEDEKEIDL
ncbi:hypothetical protein KFU94_02090 [Chloroflexi bacterium TSY]|nr:hypothetical protein [Chloroflexi bacterium TSY]